MIDGPAILPTPTNEPAPAPTPAPRREPTATIDEGRPRKLTCAFCDCEITSTRGEVLKVSDKADGFRDSSREIKERDRIIADLKHKLEAAEQKLTASAIKPAGRTTLI